MLSKSLLKRVCQLGAIVVFLSGSANIALKLYQNPYDDLPSFYWAPHLAFKQSLSPYQPDHFKELELSFRQKIYPFLYPPPSLLVFSPALLVDYDFSKAVISIINLLLWWMIAWIMCRLYFFHAHTSDRLLVATIVPLGMLFFVPIVDTLRAGQINLLALACVSPLLFPPRHFLQRLGCGLLLSIAIVLKVYLLLIIPVLIIFREWKILLGAVVGLGIFLLLSLLFLPHDLWLDWFALSHNSASYGNRIRNVLTIPWNQSLNGFFIRQFLEEKSSMEASEWSRYIYLSAGAVLCLMFYVIKRYLQYCEKGFSLALAITLLVTTIIAPLTWLHHFVFALPAIICCFGLLLQQSSIRKKIIGSMLVVSVAVMSFPPIVSMLLGGWVDCCSFEVGRLTKNLFQSVSLVAALMLFLVFCGLIYGVAKIPDSKS